MRLLAVFVAGYAIGVAVTALVGQAFSTRTPKPAAATAWRTTKFLQEKYVGRIIDEIQLALMLQATCPELVPDWLDGQIADYMMELSGELRKTTLAADALEMIEAYYTKNGLAIPPEFQTIFAQPRCKKEPWDVVKLRLSAFDKYMAARKSDTSGDLLPTVDYVSENGR